jgi:hypothetical protein
MDRREMEPPKRIQEKPFVKRRRILTSHWQESELASYLKANADNPALDSKTVFLANPTERKQIDQIIQAHLWPGIVRALVGSPIQVSGLEDGFPASFLEDEWKNNTTRSLTFVLEDTDRPFLPGEGPPWFCRGKIECSMLDYLTSFDFFAHFPMHFKLTKFIQLLSDPLFAGNPPNLTIELGRDQEQIMVLSFSEGSGAGWGLQSYQGAGEEVGEKVRKNLEVIEAIYQLEEDYTSEKCFRDLHKALREAYQAY